MSCLEPLTFNGEGNCALSNVLEFEVTDGFINLGKEVTKCQNRESFEKCSTREFLKLAFEKCACTPFSLSHLNDTVGIIKVFQRFIIFIQMNICSPSGLDCFQQISPSHLCLPPCQGLYFDVNVDKDIPQIESNLEFKPAYESYLHWKRGKSINAFKIHDNTHSIF